MYTVLQQVGGWVVAAVWIVGDVLIFLFYVRSYQRAYLRHFPPVNGVPLDMYVAGNQWGPERRAINRAMSNHQANPELERMRREVWRRIRRLVLWNFAFPVVALGLGTFVLSVLPH